MKQIHEGVEPYVSRSLDIVLGDAETDPRNIEHITEKSVREDTLRELLRKEPRLERAVEELDLELMD
mgnify:FL=1